MKFNLVVLFLFLVPWDLKSNAQSRIESRANLKNSLLANYRNDDIPLNDKPVNLTLGLAIRALNNVNQIEGTYYYECLVEIWLE